MTLDGDELSYEKGLKKRANEDTCLRLTGVLIFCCFECVLPNNEKERLRNAPVLLTGEQVFT